MMLLLPDQALESIGNHIHQARVLAKTSTEDNPSHHQEIDSALTLLEQLVQQSYDCYTTIELSDGQEMHDDAEDSETRVTQDHIGQANRIASAFLVKIVSGEMGWDDEQVERAARLLAHLSGRGGRFCCIKVALLMMMADFVWRILNYSCRCHHTHMAYCIPGSQWCTR